MNRREALRARRKVKRRLWHDRARTEALRSGPLWKDGVLVSRSRQGHNKRSHLR